IFAAAALRILGVLGVAALAAALLLLIAPLRRAFGRRPRLSLAVLGVAVLAGCVVVAQPRPGDAPVIVQMPFKVPGNEPKSVPLNLESRLPQVPAIVGINVRDNPGVNVVR